MASKELAELTASQLARRDECVAAVDEGLASFLEVGRALAEIREDKLYRGEAKSFKEYVRLRWDMGESYAYRLIDSSALKENLANWRGIRNEATARELLRAPEPDRENILEAVSGRGDKPVTAKAIRAEVDRVMTEPEPPVSAQDGPPEPPEFEPIYDCRGTEIENDAVAEIFLEADRIKQRMKTAAELRKEIKQLAGEPVGTFLAQRVQDCELDLRAVYQALKVSLPYAVVTPEIAKRDPRLAELGWCTEEQYKMVHGKNPQTVSPGVDKSPTIL